MTETIPQCRGCRRDLVPGWVACPSCGQPVTKFCPRCGIPLDQAWVACPNCGPAVRIAAHAQRGPMSAHDERTWGTLAHIAGFAGAVVPFGNILGPLVIWLVKREESTFVEYHAKESLNFQISVTIYVVISIVLVFVLIGYLLLLFLMVFQIVVMIMAALAANRGERYEYPMTIRFVQ